MPPRPHAPAEPPLPRGRIDRSTPRADRRRRGSYRVELRDEPSIMDLVEGYAHAGGGVGGRVVADGGGLIDENQDHRVACGRRYQCRGRDRGYRRNMLLLRAGSDDTGDELCVLVTEGAREPATGRRQ